MSINIFQVFGRSIAYFNIINIVEFFFNIFFKLTLVSYYTNGHCLICFIRHLKPKSNPIMRAKVANQKSYCSPVLKEKGNKS